MGVKVSFKVGNHSRFKGSMTDGLEQFMFALGEEVAEKAEENTRVDVQALTNNLSGRVERSLKAGMNFALKNMVGLKSAGAVNKGGAQPAKIHFDWDEAIDPVVNPRGGINAYSKQTGNFMGTQGDVTWQPLGPRTLKKKALGLSGASQRRQSFGRKAITKIPDKAREHFRHTGKLERDLRRLTSNIAQKTGTVKVGYIKKNAKRFNAYRGNAQYVTTGQLQITFMPKVSIRTLPGVQSGNVADTDFNMLFESSLGLTSDSIKKLKNHTELRHRPMLQPVFTYWMLNRVPRLVAGAVARSIKD